MDAHEAVGGGERRKPQPDGRPGFVRVDSVHQGDLDGRKAIYEINLVDVRPLAVGGHPVRVRGRRGGHLGALPDPRPGGPSGAVPLRDQGLPRRQRVAQRRAGSEYVNHRVAALLEKLRAEFTRSRPRRSNDNALVESKNGSVVRRHLGHAHIPARFAPLVHEFASATLSPYLNWHHPCQFATEVVRGDGKVRKVYRDADLATPYEKLRSIAGAERFLKPGVDFETLDAQAHAESDLAAARRVKEERDRLFAAIGRAWPAVA